MPTGTLYTQPRLDLPQLAVELATSGHAVPAGLGTSDSYVFTYDGSGVPANLPTGSAAVVAAHVPNATLTSLLTSVLTPAVGIAWGSLTDGQKQTLIFGLLYRAGALDNTTAQVQPLNTWLLTS